MIRIFVKFENVMKEIDLNDEINTITKLKKILKQELSLEVKLKDMSFRNLRITEAKLPTNILDRFTSSNDPLLIKLTKQISNRIYAAVGKIVDLAIDLKVSPKIFVRDCYNEIWKVFKEHENEQKKIMKQHPERIPHFYLTGTPGIGKTAFLVYMIQLLLDERRKVLFGSCAFDYFIIWESKKDFQIVDKNDIMKYTSRNDITFLMDSRNFQSTRSTIIICSSPRADIAHQYRKTAKTLYMPVWEWDEIQDLYWDIYSDILEINRLAVRFLLLGGIPRYLFDNLNLLAVEILRDAIAKTGNENLQRLAEYTAEGTTKIKTGNDLGEISHRLLHLDGSQSDSPPFGKGREKYASSYVVTMIIERYKNDRRKSIVQWIEETSTIGITGGLRGNLFEEIAHPILMKGGNFHCRLLIDQGVNKIKEIPSTKLNCVKDLSSSDLEKEGIYYKPISKNFECIDSWIVIDGETWGFQFTVSPKHRITSALYWYFKNLNIRHYVTVVFDQHKFKNYKYQAVEQSGKEPFRSEPRPTNFSDLKQYVLLYEDADVSVDDLWDIQKNVFELMVPKPWSSAVKQELETAF
jgi:DNA polymerase III delta prime subunit